MDFFTLDGWINNFWRNDDYDELGIYNKLNCVKPIFERMYNIKIDDSSLYDNKKSEKDNFNMMIKHISNNINFDYFFLNAIRESDDINESFSNLHINNFYFEDDKYLDHFKNVFVQKLIYNCVINAYISLRYKKGEKHSQTVDALFKDKDNSQFYKEIKEMQYHTILGELMGIQGFYDEPQHKNKSRKYQLPCFQLQLIQNLIGTIRKNYLYIRSKEEEKFADTIEKTNTLASDTNNKKYEKNFIVSDVFLNKLFHELDAEKNEADKIVSYYIIERMFGFNLSYHITSKLKKHKISIELSKSLIKKSQLLFKISDISSRVNYFNAIINDYCKKIEDNGNSEDKDSEEIITQFNEYENFINYIYYYYNPIINFTFLYFFQKLCNSIYKEKINDNSCAENVQNICDGKMEKILSEYIVKNQIYPNNSNEYKKYIYWQDKKNKKSKKDNVDELKLKDKDYRNILKFTIDIIAEFFECSLRTEEIENSLKYFSIKNYKNIDKAKYNQEYKKIFFQEKHKKLGNKVKELINESNPFDNYLLKKNINNICKPFILIDILRELLDYQDVNNKI